MLSLEEVKNIEGRVSSMRIGIYPICSMPYSQGKLVEVLIVGIIVTAVSRWEAQ